MDWAEKGKWLIGNDHAGPSKRLRYNGGQLIRGYEGPERNAEVKRRSTEGVGKQRQIENFPSRFQTLDKGITVVDEGKGEESIFSVRFGGEEEFLEVMCSLAKLGRDEEEIVVAYGGSSEKEMAGITTKGTKSREERREVLAEFVDEVHVFEESVSCIFPTHTLFEDAVSNSLQMIEVPKKGEHSG